ncbi:MFS transporter [Comamonas endophytica]|uniref:MFS transporter n=1 Tax=Comamonas endophytica TaxID=2949090 RepID=A0ABY6GAI1_9BURK|nr:MULTISPECIES: MFS transporter [unclassified Acidovorax]MCD2514186.1 MFS transporter [Acidovorax sp. D4N7]UYG51325.1 MFS transporter [Acidovorax sp. 5MLIR]
MQRRTQTTVMLGVAQTLSWASSYYLPAVLAEPIGRAVGMAYASVFAAFSMALLVAAATGPVAGRLIDRFGGRPVLIASNLVFAAGLALLSQATQASQVFLAWAIMGIAMGSGLYEAAFATVVRLYGQGARSAITGITLFAGFASTIGWPLSSYLAHEFGWREACLAWALLHLLLGLPLNLLLPRATRAAGPEQVDGQPADTQDSSTKAQPRRHTAYFMAYVFAVSWFISTAMAAHLPQLLQSTGTAVALAIGAAALVGPAQVAGRLIEYGLLKNAHPLLSARLAILAHPVAAICLGLIGAPAASAFAILHGLGNGILTIAVGTLPLKVFGAQGYGQRQGWLMVPARIVQAGSPLLFGMAVSRWGLGALWLSSMLAITAFLALWALRRNVQLADTIPTSQ